MRIVIAEDHENFRQVIANILQRDGHDVAEVSDGPSLLSHIVERAPDLAICDLKLPLMSGIEVLEALRQRGVRVPMVLMTGVWVEPLRADAERLGRAVLLQKPFELDDLRAAIRALA